MGLKRIYNQTAVTHSIAWRGVQLSIKPYEEQTVDEAIAAAFIERCENFVIPAPEEFAKVAEPEEVERTVWLANMTGNPDYPDEIELRVWKDKQWQWAKQPNPVKNPMMLKERHGISQKEYTAKDGVLEALNLPGKMVTLSPYQRREFKEGMAKWFTSRSLMSSPQSHSGTFPKVIESRPPSAFEPDMSWDLNAIMAYLKFVDPDCKMGRDEQTIRRANKRKTEEEIKQLIHEEKRAVMKRLYFRLVDPQYRLPSRGEFEAFMKGPQAVQPEEVEKADEELLALTEPDAVVSAQ